MGNLERNFVRGEVFMVDFGKEEKGDSSSYLIQKLHRVVVLFDSSYPRKTVIVIPISSLYDEHGQMKETIPDDVILKASDYQSASEDNRRVIPKDSFIMTNQVRSVTRDRLESCKGRILPEDMMELDLKIISAMGLQATISALVEAEVEARVDEVLRVHGIERIQKNS